MLRSYTIACVPCLKEGETYRYIGNSTYKGIYLMKGEEITEPLEITSTSDGSYINGSFTLVWGRTNEYIREYYIKLAGVYYIYSDYSFRWSVISQYEYESNMAAMRDWYYGVYDEATDTWTYYNKYECVWDYDLGDTVYRVSEPLDAANLPQFTTTPTSYVVGSLPDGQQIYEFSGYVMGDILALRRADGTVFYYKDGSTKGYLKLQDGTYTAATLITDPADGSTRIVCTNLAKATLSDTALDHYGVFDEYISYKHQNSAVVIDKAILAAIPEEIRDDFRLTINTGYGSKYLTYDELVGWFALGEAQYIGGTSNEMIEDPFF